jgi:large subunit ribosomal protein L15
MMNLSELKPLVGTTKKRVGRGEGSGKAKTAGRGTKGQKARGTTRPGFEGGQLPLIKRLPFRRGLGNTSHRHKPLAINAVRLTMVPVDAVITPDLLKQYGLVPMTYAGPVKVIGLTGEEKFTFEGIQLTKVAIERLKG